LAATGLGDEKHVARAALPAPDPGMTRMIYATPQNSVFISIIASDRGNRGIIEGTRVDSSVGDPEIAPVVEIVIHGL